MKPGVPIHIEATAEGVLTTNDVEFSIVMPEVEAAELGGWQRMIMPDRKLTSAEYRGELRSGQARKLSVSVTIPVAGYFRAIARIAKRSSESDFAESRAVRTITTTEIWFFVDSISGRVTNGFEPGVLPQSAAQRSGPIQPRTGKLARALTSLSSPTISRTLGASSSLVTWDGTRRLMYYDADSGKAVPAVGVTVYSQQCEYVSGTCYADTYDLTDSNGKFYPVCAPSYDYEMRGEMRLEGGSLFRWLGNNNVGSFTEDRDSCNFDYGEWMVPDVPLEVFSNLNLLIPRSRTVFPGYSRGRVDVRVGDFGGTNYNTSSDVITVQSTGAQATIWGAFGIYAQAHEYGHALHAIGLGGNFASGTCSNGHDFSQHTSLPCAFSEGFATYFGTLVAPTASQSGNNLVQIEGNNWYNGPNAEDVEGSVAALMYDLTDGANEAHDSVQLDPSYVLTVISGCRMWRGSVFGGISGVDDFIYCAENGVDPAASGQLTMRDPPASVTVFFPQPSGWSQAAVRSIWRKNLFNLL